MRSVLHILLIISLSSPLSGQQYIGQFNTFIHNVRSGWVTIVDDKTIEIQNFSYDGQGPAAWFVVGRGQNYRQERADLRGYTVLPDENFSCQRLKAYNRKSIQLTLPGEMTFHDVDYLAVYCLEFNHNFGYISIPKNLNVAPVGANNLGECRTRWISNVQFSEFPPSRPAFMSNLLSRLNDFRESLSNFFSFSK